jgi:hypothetical protein
MSGQMLHHRDDVFRDQPGRQAGAEPRDDCGLRRESAIADHGIRVGVTQIQHRGRDDIEPGGAGHGTQSAAMRENRLSRFQRRGGGQVGPERGAQPGHPATLLVHHQFCSTRQQFSQRYC